MDCCGHEGRGSGDARFDVKKVADGVHVAVATPAYKVNSNTAIIESDDGVVIVDTHSKPSAARVIVERLRDITTKPVRYVVNTQLLIRKAAHASKPSWSTGLAAAFCARARPAKQISGV